MSKVSDELRARAAVLDKRRAGWVQTEPSEPGQLCAVFDYNNRTNPRCVVSRETVMSLDKWLIGYIREQYPEYAEFCDASVISTTMFNDEVVGSVDEVIAAFEKAAADLD